MPETQIQIQGVNVLADEFERYPRGARRAIVRSLDRGGSAAETSMARSVSTDAALKIRDVKASFRRRRPSETDPVYTLAAGFKRIPLIKFGARGPIPSRGRGKGVSYRMGAGNSRNRLPNAFIATMRSGHQGVFARVTRGRTPIRELYGPSLGRVFAKYRGEALARGLAVFESTLDHELERLRG